MYKESFVKTNGKLGTYTTNYGGTGLAYNIGNEIPIIVKSVGNGFYYPVDNLSSFVEDNGAGYFSHIKKIPNPKLEE